MVKTEVIDNCHLCGVYKKLTYEHTPPEKAFNNRRVFVLNLEQAIKLGPGEIQKGRQLQRGFGAYTLCGDCNSFLGRHYSRKYIDFCYQGMSLLQKTNGDPNLIYLNYVFPLAIIKQIIAIFLCINTVDFRNDNEELVRFVMNRDNKGLPEKYRFFLYYNILGKMRVAGLSIIATHNDNFGDISTIPISEFSFPPYGFVMTINSPPPDKRLYDITYFTNYDFNEFKILTMKLEVLPTHLIYPGDYRTKEEIEHQSNESKRFK